MAEEPFGNLKYMGIEIKPCPQNPDEACLFVRFMDEDTGKLWEWMPEWKPVRELFEKSSNVEVLNFPKSEYTSDFAKVSKRVFDKITRNIQGAELIQGVIQEVDRNKLVIESEENSYLLPTGFDISSEKFLWDWLDREIKGLVVNEILVEMKTATGLSYPPNISEVKRKIKERLSKTGSLSVHELSEKIAITRQGDTGYQLDSIEVPETYVQEAIDELIEDDEVYEPKPGEYKLLG